MWLATEFRFGGSAQDIGSDYVTREFRINGPAMRLNSSTVLDVRTGGFCG